MTSLLALEDNPPIGIAPAFDHGVDALAARVALHVESLVPRGRARCLDIACGDPTLAAAIRARTTRAEWHCVDVLDAEPLPFADGEFDVALLCDVLHDEREDSARLLAEVGRVAQYVLVKDRFAGGADSRTMLRGADLVAGSGRRVSFPHRCFTREAFVRLAADRRLRITALDSELDLHEHGPIVGTVLPPDSHFIAVLHA